MNRKLSITLVLFFLGMYSLFAQSNDPGCGDPLACCTCRVWTISGSSNPSANSNVVYTVTPGPSPNNWQYVRGHTVRMVIYASTLFKVEVDGVLQMFNAGTTKVFEKLVPDCVHENGAAVSWNLKFLQSGRSGTIYLLDKSPCHDSAGSIDFTTN